ncbi:ornithine cyclodeaminase family protein [Kaistia dalseonensis]|uniref:Ornithine cyclodeaminase n=1 Tax=Kaistia dalseonensis TaxID=410840 RepID=A0ABU0HAB6_9HYPH|nr:ornithine cyclodeaminase family protein [Kaistia dalseonensis]MCX5496640.1 ornithine cyclodeaminase family protein [Kaistia dalseonensis]MDQ0439263.1 ornithine cyclodeaminase [Kaistia dalseonensis]
MLHITDDMVAEAVTIAEAQAVMRDAFESFGRGRASMQERIRTEAGGVKLSTLGAVIPDLGVTGAKVYTTIAGQFSFAISLFSTEDGRPLASLEANAITRLRTPACSVLAARHLARADSRRLALFGTGVQGRAHAIQMASAYPLAEILIVSSHPNAMVAEAIATESGVAARLASAEEAVANADIIVTASRSKTALFDGSWLQPGTFISAVGSSLPNTRELDDLTLARSSIIAVEWRPQSLREAGDLVLGARSALPDEKIAELGELVTAQKAGRTDPTEITLYKSVGVGLEDIALAGLAYRKIVGA